jgi:hypothetical protein
MKKLANHVVLTLIFQNNNELRRTQSLIHAFETAVNEVNKDTLWFPILAIVLAPTEYAGQYGIQLSNPITSILSSSDVETLPDRISFVYPEDHVEFFYSKDPIR